MSDESSGDYSDNEDEDFFSFEAASSDVPVNALECLSCLFQGKFIMNKDNQLTCPSCGVLFEDVFTQREEDDEEIFSSQGMKKINKKPIEHEKPDFVVIKEFYQAIKENILSQIEHMIEELHFSENVKFYFMKLWEKMLEKSYQSIEKEQIPEKTEIRSRRGRKRKNEQKDDIIKTAIDVTFQKEKELLKEKDQVDLYLKLKAWHTISILYYAVLCTKEPIGVFEFRNYFETGKIPYKKFGNLDDKRNILLKAFYKEYLIIIPRSNHIWTSMIEFVNAYNLDLPSYNPKPFLYKIYRDCLRFPSEGCYSIEKFVKLTLNLIQLHLKKDDYILEFQNVISYQPISFIGSYVIIVMKIMFGLAEKEGKMNPFIDQLSRFLMKNFQDDTSLLYENTTVYHKNESFVEIVNRIKEVDEEEEKVEKNMKWDEEDEELESFFIKYTDGNIHYQCSYFAQVLSHYFDVPSYEVIRKVKIFEKEILKTLQSNQSIHIIGKVY